MNLKDAFYHGIRQQIRTVLERMGPERVDGGLTAFEDGASNWSECFFARAYPDLNLERRPEMQLKEALALPTLVPIKIVYRAFDGLGVTMTKDQMRQFVESVRDESRPAEVLAVLRTVDYTNVETTEVTSGSCR